MQIGPGNDDYSKIAKQYGQEIADALDKMDGSQDKNISERSLSIFNEALKAYEAQAGEEKQSIQKVNKFSNNINNILNAELEKLQRKREETKTQEMPESASEFAKMQKRDDNYNKNLLVGLLKKANVPTFVGIAKKLQEIQDSMKKEPRNQVEEPKSDSDEKSVE